LSFGPEGAKDEAEPEEDSMTSEWDEMMKQRMREENEKWNKGQEERDRAEKEREAKEEERRQRKRDKARKRHIIAVGGGLLVLICIIGALGAGVYDYTVLDSHYNKTVHGYIVNAEYSDNPTAMAQNISEALQGMHALGLTDGMSSAIFGFQQNPSNGMANQYAQMSIELQRCETLETMNITNYNYQPTLANIQLYLSNNNGGWGDEVADGCYLYAENAFMTAWIFLVFLVVAVLGCLLALLSDMLVRDDE